MENKFENEEQKVEIKYSPAESEYIGAVGIQGNVEIEDPSALVESNDSYQPTQEEIDYMAREIREEWREAAKFGDYHSQSKLFPKDNHDYATEEAIKRLKGLHKN